MKRAQALHGIHTGRAERNVSRDDVVDPNAGADFVDVLPPDKARHGDSLVAGGDKY